MDSAPAKPLAKGKREAEDAIEMEIVSAKKQKVEEQDFEMEMETETVDVEKNVDTSFDEDASRSNPDQLIKVKASGKDGHVVSELEDKRMSSKEDTGSAKTEPACTAKEGFVASVTEIDEPNETSLNEDVAATLKAPASLVEEESDASPKDVTILDENVSAVNLSLPAPCTEKSLVFIQKKDDSRTHEFDSGHETNTDENIASDKKASLAPTEKGPVVSWRKEDELCSDNERFGIVEAESTLSVLTKKEDKANDELELNDETNSSDDDHQTPATPTEQTTGGKTLYVGNLSFSVEQEDVENFFKATGEVVDIHFAMNSDETFKGYGFVKFASAEAAEKALLELNGKELLRRRVKLQIAKERGLLKPYTSQDTNFLQKAVKAQGQTIFVHGFNKSDCQDEIRKSLEEHFGSCGEISRVSVPKDQDGCARGIAFIEFKDRAAFTQALALNGSEFREGTLSVKEAMSKGDNRDSAGEVRGYGGVDERYSRQDFGARSGRLGVCGSSVHETGLLFGAGVWLNSSGRGDWQKNPSGRSGCQNTRTMGVWQNSRGRGDWENSSGRGVRHNSCGRGDWENSRGRGVWQNSSGRSDSGRGVGYNSCGRGVGYNSYGRGVGYNSCGRGDWENSRGRGVWQNSNGRSNCGRGDWENSRGSGVWQNSSRRSDCGRGDWENSRGRGVWQNSSRRGVRYNSCGRGDWENSRGRGAWQNSDGRSDFGRGDWKNSRGRNVWQNSSGRGDWKNSRGRDDWENSSRRGIWQGSSGRSVFRGFSGRGVFVSNGETAPAPLRVYTRGTRAVVDYSSL